MKRQLLMSDFIFWLTLLVGKWQSWVAGAGVAGLAIIILLFIERFSGWTMNKLWFILIFIVFYILGASFVVWKDEHNRLIELQAKMDSPNFIVEIGGISSGEINGQPLIVVGGFIRNPNGPPSAVFDWKMIVEFPSGKKIVGIAPLISGKDIEMELSSLKDAKVILRADKYWPAISTTPIMSGSALEGWFWATFPGLDLKEAYKENASISIEIRDAINNKSHIFSKKLIGYGIINLPAGTLPSC